MVECKSVDINIWRVEKNLKKAFESIWLDIAPDYLSRGFSRLQITEFIGKFMQDKLNELDDSGEWTVTFTPL